MINEWKLANADINIPYSMWLHREFDKYFDEMSSKQGFYGSFVLFVDKSGGISANSVAKC